MNSMKAGKRDTEQQKRETSGTPSFEEAQESENITETEKSAPVWPLTQIPFRSYGDFTDYYLHLVVSGDAQSKKEAHRLVNLILESIGSYPVHTHQHLTDFAQLVYMNNDDITSAVFCKFNAWCDDSTEPGAISTAIVEACRGLQAIQTGRKCVVPDTSTLIQLLDKLAVRFIEGEQASTGRASGSPTAEALTAINALLDVLVQRALVSRSGVTINIEAKEQLEKCLKSVEASIREDKGLHPQHFFLCGRARESLECLTTCLTPEKRKEGKAAAVKGVLGFTLNVTEAGGSFLGGSVALGFAITAVVLGMGAGVALIPPAAVAFGSGCYGAGKFLYQAGGNGVKVYTSLQMLRHHLQHGKMSTLDELDAKTRRQPASDAFDWDALRQLFEESEHDSKAIVDKDNRPVAKWKRLDAMKAVHYLTTLALKFRAPDEFMSWLQGLMKGYYQSHSKKSQAVVRGFMLMQWQRLHDAGYDFPVKPDALAQRLLDAPEGFAEVKGYVSLTGRERREANRQNKRAKKKSGGKAMYVEVRCWHALDDKTQEAMEDHQDALRLLSGDRDAELHKSDSAGSEHELRQQKLAEAWENNFSMDTVLCGMPGQSHLNFNQPPGLSVSTVHPIQP